MQVNKKLVNDHKVEEEKLTYTIQEQNKTIEFKFVPYKERYLFRKTIITENNKLIGKTFINIDDFNKLKNEIIHKLNR